MNLIVALRLGQLLEECGAQVIYTEPPMNVFHCQTGQRLPTMPVRIYSSASTTTVRMIPMHPGPVQSATRDLKWDPVGYSVPEWTLYPFRITTAWVDPER